MRTKLTAPCLNCNAPKMPHQLKSGKCGECRSLPPVVTAPPVRDSEASPTAPIDASEAAPKRKKSTRKAPKRKAAKNKSPA